MQSAPKPSDESSRLETLTSLNVLDTPADPVLDGLVRAAARLIGCPVSLVSLVDEKRQWFKARHGTDALETPRELAFCAHAILQTDLFEVRDARLDVRFADNPLVTGEPHIIFYVGVPLSVEGRLLGTLCVIDHQPRELTPEQRDLLQDLARSAEHWLRSQHINRRLQCADADRRNLFDHMGDGMLLLDRNFQVIEANRSTARMLGHSPDELRRMRLHDLLPASEHTRLTRTALHVLKGVERLADWQMLRRDGSSFMAEVSTRVVDDERFVVVLRDITQRHAQKQEVRLLSMAVEQSAQSIVITDLNGNIEYVNAAALSTSGYAMHEMLGRNPRFLQSGKTPRETYEQMWRKLSAGKPWRGLLFNRRKDGVDYVEDATITPIRDAQGRVAQYLALMLDVTERRRLSEELERHQLHLEELVEQRTVALVAARRAAEAANQAKSAFLATMSHEIRTPMNGVVGSIDLLQRSELSHYQRDLTDTVSESALALLGIIDDILDFSKIEAGQLKLICEPVALVRLADSVCDALRASAAQQGVELQVEVASDLPDWVLSDAGRLRQILNNLLGNAIKFSADTGRPGLVELRVQTGGPELAGHVQLQVNDNGIGMTPEAQQRIFQPFVQAESATTRRFGGTGLGLSICKRLVGLMGGWIEVVSEPGRGSTFTATLPVQPAQTPRHLPDDRPAKQLQTGPRFAMSGGPLVLVAEDNEINQRVISHQLALMGVSVEMANDGLDALARWRAGRATQRHSLLLTDLHMPGIDGYTLAATIRSEEGAALRLPIVALSANAMSGEIDRCRLAGMDDYLSKPVQLEQFRELLQRWLPTDDGHALESLDPLESTDAMPAMECNEMDVFEVELGDVAFDDHALARLVGDDPALLAEFRQRFVLSSLNTMDEMRRAAGQGDTAALADLAHRLKSSSRAVGAIGLAACCERIERASPLSAAPQMHIHMAAMEDALADVMTRLGAYLRQEPSDMTI